jgi:curved DNA-binding protein CbpA
MSGTTPEPIAQGEIAKTPFAHVLLHVHHKQMSGTLVLWPTGEGVKGQDRILFEQGWPVAGRLVDKAAALDRGMLPLFARKQGPYAFYDVDLVGDAPLKGRVDPLMVLAASLRGSVRDDVVEAYVTNLGLDAHVRFKVGSDVKRYQLQPKEAGFVDVIRAAPAVVSELIGQCELGPVMGKRLLYLLFVTRALERFDPRVSLPQARASSPGMARAPMSAGAPVPSVPPAAATTTSEPGTGAPFDLPLPDMPVPDEPLVPQARTSMVGAPAPMGTASSAGAMPSPAAASGTSGTGRPSLPMQADRAGAARFTSSMPQPPPAPAGLSADGATFWNEVVERSRVIDRQNYYDMLGVPRDVGAEGVRKSYFALAKRWHPDRTIGELAPLREFVEPIFSLFTSAQETLSDEKKRAAYLRTVQDGGGTPEADRKLEAILWAAKEHSKAEVLVRQRHFEAAAALLSSAIEIVSDEPDLLATYAWCLFNLPNSDGRLQDMQVAVERALAIEPKHDRAHYYKGMIQQRQGKEADALTSFRKALELNKKNADAAREVRLAEMRGKSGTTGKNTASAATAEGDKKADGGFLSKLFGSSKKS